MTSPHLTSSPLAPWSTELVQLAVHTSTGDLAYRSLSHPAADRTWRPLRDTDDEAAAVTIESTEASDVPLAPLTLLTPLVEHLGGLAGTASALVLSGGHNCHSDCRVYGLLIIPFRRNVQYTGSYSTPKYAAHQNMQHGHWYQFRCSSSSCFSSLLLLCALLLPRSSDSPILFRVINCEPPLKVM